MAMDQVLYPLREFYLNSFPKYLENSTLGSRIIIVSIVYRYNKSWINMTMLKIFDLAPNVHAFVSCTAGARQAEAIPTAQLPLYFAASDPLALAEPIHYFFLAKAQCETLCMLASLGDDRGNVDTGNLPAERPHKYQETRAKNAFILYEGIRASPHSARVEK